MKKIVWVISLCTVFQSVGGKTNEFSTNSRYFVKSTSSYELSAAPLKDRMLEAAALYETGNYRSAKHKYSLLQIDYPENAEIRYELSRCYYRMGQGYLAVNEVERALALRPDYLDAYIHLLQLLHDGGQGTKMLERFDMAPEEVKKNPTALMLKANMHARYKNKTKAISSMNDAISIAPENEVIIKKAAYLYLQLMELEKAEELFIKLGEINPDNIHSLSGQARALSLQGKKEEALQYLNRAEKIKPDDINVLSLKAEFLILKGDVNSGIEQYQAIVEKHPDNFQSQMRLAHLFISQGEKDNAINIAEHMTKQTRPDALVYGHMLMATLAYNDRYYDKAIKHARSALSKREEYTVARLMLAQSYYAKKEYTRALSETELILEKDSESMGAKLLKVKILEDSGSEDKAIDFLKETIPLHPGKNIYRIELGRLYYNQSNLDAAVETWKEILDMEPENATAINNIAMALAEQEKELDYALSLATNLIKKAPGNPGVSDTYGWVLLKNNKIDEAIKYLSFAVERNPKNPEIQYHTGVAYYKKGDLKKAQTHLEKALYISSDFFSAKNTRKILKEVQQKIKNASDADNALIRDKDPL